MNTDGMRAIDELVNVGIGNSTEPCISEPSPIPFAKRTKAKQRMTTTCCPQCAKSPLSRLRWTQRASCNTFTCESRSRKGLYEQTGDVFTVQEMLGHKSIATTQKYLGVNYASVREALQKMSLDGELHETGILGSSLKSTADETLFFELALRGYDLSRLRDDTETEATAEIVKIG